ncbi:MAG: cation:proton antiporter [Candidatus Baltobacteraceae bacterium]
MLDAIGVSLGGGAIGLASAFIVSQVLRSTVDAPLQIVATVVAGYGSYLAADDLHMSGLFAALAAGIALRGSEHFPASSEATEKVDTFWAVLAFFANSLLCLLVGTLHFASLAHLLIVYGRLPLVDLEKSQRSSEHVVALSGMRGALSLALALSLPDGIPFRPQIIDAVFRRRHHHASRPGSRHRSHLQHLMPRSTALRRTFP